MTIQNVKVYKLNYSILKFYIVIFNFDFLTLHLNEYVHV